MRRLQRRNALPGSDGRKCTTSTQRRLEPGVLLTDNGVKLPESRVKLGTGQLSYVIPGKELVNWVAG
jgi:hypothetical protein